MTPNFNYWNSHDLTGAHRTYIGTTFIPVRVVPDSSIPSLNAGGLFSQRVGETKNIHKIIDPVDQLLLGRYRTLFSLGDRPA